MTGAPAEGKTVVEGLPVMAPAEADAGDDC